MRSYLSWIDDPEKGFWIDNVWNYDEDCWALESGYLELTPLQRRILDHCLDVSSGKPRYQTVYYSCPKKSGKTTVEASVAGWFGDEAPVRSEIYAIANDAEQTEYRMLKVLKHHYKHRGIPYLKSKIRLPNETEIIALAQEYKSAAGGWPALTLWDELWGYTSKNKLRLWKEMTPIPTVPISLRFVCTYAGYRDEDPNLLWDNYERVVLNGTPVPELIDITDREGNPVCFVSQDGYTFAYWDTEPRMPWQTDEYYRAQAAELDAVDFVRFHRNGWVTSQNPFIDMKYWHRAVRLGSLAGIIQQLRYMPESEYFGYPVSIAVDAAEKHDCCVIVAVYWEPNTATIRLADCQVWEPAPDKPHDIEETVEKYLEELFPILNIQSIRYDPRQLHRTMTSYKKRGLPVEEFTQTVANMEKACQNLYDLMITGRFLTYDHDKLKEHIEFATGETKGRGTRIVKDKHSKVKVDAAVALAMAAYDAVERANLPQQETQTIYCPFGDAAEIRIPEEATINVLGPDGRPVRRSRREFEESLPPALRSAGYNKKEVPDWFKRRHG